LAAGCLVGNEQSLTLANLDCQIARSARDAVEIQPQDAFAEQGMLHDLPDDELPDSSGAELSPSLKEPGHGVTVRMPVRFVRYWLAGVMPLVAQAAASEEESGNTEKMELSVPEIGTAQEMGTTDSMGTVGENETEDGATGLYREEVVGLGSPARMRPLRDQGVLESLDDHGNDLARVTGTPGLSAPGFHSPYETENSEEVTRHSFHLAQVEWAKFQYFDGNRWKSSWDSRVQGELPVAIEMSLWLLRRGSKPSVGSMVQEMPGTPEAEMTWTEVETMRDADSQWPGGQEGRQAEAAPEELPSSAEDNPMERQPEVRQLVVLRTAPVPGDRPTDENPSGNSLSGAGPSRDGDRQETHSQLSPEVPGREW